MGICRLTLKTYSDNTFSTEEGEFISTINPSNLRIYNDVVHTSFNTLGNTNYGIRFNSIQPRVMSFSLLFDNSGVFPNSETEVKNQLESIESLLVKYQENMNEPYYIRVIWGNIDFKGKLSKMTTDYTSFKNDGTPIRAQVDVKILEYLNPTLNNKNSGVQDNDKENKEASNDDNSKKGNNENNKNTEKNKEQAENKVDKKEDQGNDTDEENNKDHEEVEQNKKEEEKKDKDEKKEGEDKNGENENKEKSSNDEKKEEEIKKEEEVIKEEENKEEENKEDDGPEDQEIKVEKPNISEKKEDRLKILNAIKDNVSKAPSKITSLVSAVQAKAGDSFPSLLKRGLSSFGLSLMNILDMIKVGICAFGAFNLLNTLRKIPLGFVALIKKLWDIIKSLVKKAIDGIKRGFTYIKKKFTSKKKKKENKVVKKEKKKTTNKKSWWQRLKEKFKNAKNRAKQRLQNFKNRAKKRINNATSRIKNKFKKKGNNTGNGIKT